jgi:hypothetical protein
MTEIIGMPNVKTAYFAYHLARYQFHFDGHMCSAGCIHFASTWRKVKMFDVSYAIIDETAASLPIW